MFDININFTDNEHQFVEWNDYSFRFNPIFLEINLINDSLSITTDNTGGTPVDVCNGLIYRVRLPDTATSSGIESFIDSEDTTSLLDCIASGFIESDNGVGGHLNDRAHEAYNELEIDAGNISHADMEFAADINIEDFWEDCTIDEAIDDAEMAYDEIIIIGCLHDSFIEQAIELGEQLEEGEFLPECIMGCLLEISGDYIEYFE